MDKGSQRRKCQSVAFTIFITFLGIFLSCEVLGKETRISQPQENIDFTPQFKPTVTIKKTGQSITIDGRIDDPGWDNAVTVTGFSEVEPGDQVEPLVKTEVLATYDDENLYIEFMAYDNPEEIRTTLRDRDEAFNDDFVGLLLDTYGDASWAYELFVNPYGIQMDGRMTSDNEDMGFDVLFRSEGAITDKGYQVEIAIPFRSLRFPNQSEHAWRITFIRAHPRDKQHLYSWAAVNRDNPCVLCQLGTLNGIRGITTGRNLEFFPEIVANQSKELKDENDPDSGFDNSLMDGDVSLGIKYNISSSVTADLALNPDFSQVEADPARIDVNSTFALSFQERRPFFQEGSDLFDTDIRAVYTRSINDPSVALKLTSRASRVSAAYIGALDEQTPIILPFEEQSETVGSEKQIRSISNIARLKRTFGEESFLGALITDRRLPDGGSGSLLSTDGAIRFWDNYLINWQLTASHIAEPNDTSLTSDMDPISFGRKNYTAAFDGEQFWGHAISTTFTREARHWIFYVNYREYSPAFRAANGFVTSNNQRGVSGRTQYVFYPETKIFERFGIGTNGYNSWNYSGDFKEKGMNPYIWGQFIGQTYMEAGASFDEEVYQDIRFTGIRGWGIFINSRFSDMFSVGGGINAGDEIARNLDTPKLGHARSINLFITFKPMDRLVFEPEYNAFKLTDTQADTTIYDGYILRGHLNLQLSRRLHVRAILQYDDFNKAIDFDPLITYRINAFSAVYLGSTHDMRKFDDPAGYKQTSRQYFLKVKYLFQL